MTKEKEITLDLEVALAINDTLCQLSALLPDGDIGIEIRTLCTLQAIMYKNLINNENTAYMELRKTLKYCESLNKSLVRLKKHS